MKMLITGVVSLVAAWLILHRTIHEWSQNLLLIWLLRLLLGQPSLLLVLLHEQGVCRATLERLRTLHRIAVWVRREPVSLPHIVELLWITWHQIHKIGLRSLGPTMGQSHSNISRRLLKL